jgi:hypothetical protein
MQGTRIRHAPTLPSPIRLYPTSSPFPPSFLFTKKIRACLWDPSTYENMTLRTDFPVRSTTLYGTVYGKLLCTFLFLAICKLASPATYLLHCEVLILTKQLSRNYSYKLSGYKVLICKELGSDFLILVLCMLT